jgi:ribosome maturation protein Sdo1
MTRDYKKIKRQLNEKTAELEAQLALVSLLQSEVDGHRTLAELKMQMATAKRIETEAQALVSELYESMPYETLRKKLTELTAAFSEATTAYNKLKELGELTEQDKQKYEQLLRKHHQQLSEIEKESSFLQR